MYRREGRPCCTAFFVCRTPCLGSFRYRVHPPMEPGATAGAGYRLEEQAEQAEAWEQALAYDAWWRQRSARLPPRRARASGVAPFSRFSLPPTFWEDARLRFPLPPGQGLRVPVRAQSKRVLAAAARLSSIEQWERGQALRRLIAKPPPKKRKRSVPDLGDGQEIRRRRLEQGGDDSEAAPPPPGQAPQE